MESTPPASRSHETTQRQCMIDAAAEVILGDFLDREFISPGAAEDSARRWAAEIVDAILDKCPKERR